MSARFRGESTPIAGMMILHRLPISDERGSFERLFCVDELRSFGHPGIVAQVNRSVTRLVGAMRGMHYQRAPHGEWKVISCLRGAVHDVIVDLRGSSSSFLRWHAVELSDAASISLLVPPGCAHGFQVLRGEAEMMYVHSHPYVPAADAGVRSDDARLGIVWPLSVTERSARDAAHPVLSTDFTGVES